MTCADLKIQLVIHPWDSVINHYPVSNHEVNKKMEMQMKKYFGNVGMRYTHSSSLNRIYRKIKSYRDTSPGRLFSFLAKTEDC